MKNTTKRYELKKLQEEFPTRKIKSSQDGYEFIKQFYQDDIEVFESFFILLLNQANKTIGYAKISQGGVSGTVVDVKLIAKYAIDSLAASVVLAHNHPSGTLRASSADDQVTEKIQKGLRLLDVKVLDHLILTPDNGYLSMADEGLM